MKSKSVEDFIEENFEHILFINEISFSYLDLNNLEFFFNQLTTFLIVILEDVFAFWLYKHADAFWKYFSNCCCLKLSCLAKQHIYNISQYDVRQINDSKWIVIRNVALEESFKSITINIFDQSNHKKIENLLKELLSYDDTALTNYGLSKSHLLEFLSSKNLPASCPICKEDITLRQKLHFCKKLRVNGSESRESFCNNIFYNGKKCPFDIGSRGQRLLLTYHHKSHHYSQCSDDNCTFLSHKINKAKITSLLSQQTRIEHSWYYNFFRKIRNQDYANIIIVNLKSNLICKFNFQSLLNIVKPSCFAICDHYGARQSCNCSHSILKTYNFFTGLFIYNGIQCKVKSISSLNKNIQSLQLKNVEDFLIIFVKDCRKEYSISKKKIIKQMLSQLFSIQNFFGLKVIIILPGDFVDVTYEKIMLVDFLCADI